MEMTLLASIRKWVLIAGTVSVLLLATLPAFGSEGPGANPAGGATGGSTPSSTAAAPGLSPRETELENRFGIPEPTETAAGAADFSILSGAGAFTFVLCLAALATLLVSYFVKHRRLPAFGKKRELPRPRVRVLESIPLGQRRFLTLVETGGEVHLLGVTPAQVNYLVRLPGKNAADAADEARVEATVRAPLQAPSLIQQLSPGKLQSATTGNFEEQYKQLRAMLGGQ